MARGGFAERTPLALDQTALEWARQGAVIRDLLEHAELAREAFELAQGAEQAFRSPVEVEDVIVPMDGSGPVTVRLFRPEQVPGELPVVLYCHGPGWTLGSSATHDRLMRDLALCAGAAVAFVEYTRAPEARYPVALDECQAAAAWLTAHGARHRLDAERIAVAGDSAGATLATGLTLLAREQELPRYRGQLLLCPWCDASLDWPSYKELGDRYPWGASAVARFWRSYLPDGFDEAGHTISPVRASARELAGLPPALVITAEGDVARDEGEAYAEKLQAAGVPTRALCFQALADFMVIDALCESGAARTAMACAGAFLRERLSRQAG
jgi:acetyl esterase